MESDIFLVGPSYCGKSELCKIIEQFVAANEIHVGDCVRKRYEKWGEEVPMKISCDDLVDIIRENIMFGHSNIIDNAFKDPCQASKVLEMYDEWKRSFSIIWINDKRTNVDFTSRGRADDDRVIAKRKDWNKFSKELWTLLSTKYKDFLTVVENTNEGFVFKKVS